MADLEPRNFLQPCLLLLLAERADHGYELASRLRPLHDGEGDSGGVYRALRGMVPGSHDRVARKQVTEAVRITADWLGNTPAVARGSYVHPAVLDAYLEGSFRGVGRATDDEAAPAEAVTTAATAPIAPGLPDPAEEAAVLRILRRQRRANRS